MHEHYWIDRTPKPLLLKPDYAKAQIALAAPQPSKAVSVWKGWCTTITGLLTVTLWGALGEALPYLTPDILQAVMAKVVAHYPWLTFLKVPLFLALLGSVKAAQNYYQVRSEAMKLNRSAPGVVTVTSLAAASLVKTRRKR